MDAPSFITAAIALQAFARSALGHGREVSHEYLRPQDAEAAPGTRELTLSMLLGRWRRTSDEPAVVPGKMCGAFTLIVYDALGGFLSFRKVRI